MLEMRILANVDNELLQPIVNGVVILLIAAVRSEINKTLLIYK
jgi:hypothetical protein